MSDWISDLLFWVFFGFVLFSLRRQRMFWTVGALALLLLFNQFFTPGFFHIQLLNGHFYGSRIDVLNQGGDSRHMVGGFVNSTEYRNRFGP